MLGRLAMIARANFEVSVYEHGSSHRTGQVSSRPVAWCLNPRPVIHSTAMRGSTFRRRLALLLHRHCRGPSMRRSLALAIAGLLCGTAVSACSEEEPAASPTVSSAASSTSPATRSQPTESTNPKEPTTTEPQTDPVKPVLPEAAKEQSQAGARAFIQHYVEVLNYSYARTRAGPLRAVSSPSCTVCQYLFQDLNEMNRRKGQQVGGEWAITQIEPLAEHTATSTTFIVGIEIARGYSAETAKSPRRVIRRQSVFDEIEAVWRRGRWLVENVTPA